MTTLRTAVWTVDYTAVYTAAWTTLRPPCRPPYPKWSVKTEVRKLKPKPKGTLRGRRSPHDPR